MPAAKGSARTPLDQYRNHNNKLWEYKYTNQNTPLFKIIGTNQSKQSICLVDNYEVIVLDLERLFVLMFVSSIQNITMSVLVNIMETLK